MEKGWRLLEGVDNRTSLRTEIRRHVKIDLLDFHLTIGGNLLEDPETPTPEEPDSDEDEGTDADEDEATAPA
jgi:hypothetical protein